MSIAVFSPYGLASEETGILALLANYLGQQQVPATSLHCNGIFSLCDRDMESAGRRSIRSCFTCLYEQRAVARWAGIPFRELSSFLTPDDIEATRRWALRISASNFSVISFEGDPLFPLIQRSFLLRTSAEHPDWRNPEHEDAVRRLMISSARMLIAGERFLAQNQPQLLLVAGVDGFLGASMLRAAHAAGVPVAQFSWRIESRSVVITHPVAERTYSCPLVFEDVTTMRADSRTWPGEIVRIVDELLVFLDISSSQLALPLAQ